MATTKLVTLERLTQFKTLQDQYNVATFLGLHATADKATVLATARTIDGVSFDGSANITLPTKIVRVYSNEGTFYTDSAKTVAFTGSSVTDPTEKLFIDVTTGKAAFWNGTALQYVEAADTTPRIAVAEKGVANGVATLGNDGKVPAAQLPSFVDDVIEVEGSAKVDNNWVLYSDAAKTQAIASGEEGKIYVDKNATVDGTFRWSGSAWVQVGANVSSADAAIKATQDGNGDVISTTYVKVEAGKGLMTDTQADQLASLVADQADTTTVTEAEINAMFGITPSEP